MFTAWGGNTMRNIATIARYEAKMQLKNVGFWLLLAFGLAISLFDNFPSQANMKRLNFLGDQGYVVSRLMMQSGLVLLFGLMFLVSDRIRSDKKSGAAELYMATPLSQKQYILGKFTGNYAASLLLLGIYLAVNASVHLFFNPTPFNLLPYIAGFIVVAMPAAFFVVACSIILPAIVDIRLFYAVFSAYFLYNIIVVPATHSRPFYMLIGDLVKVVFTYGFAASYQSMSLNFVFLIGLGAVSIALLLWNKRFWRESR